MSFPSWLALVLFSVTYVSLAIGRVPGLRMDRAGIALVGATAMMVCGLVSFEEAFSSQCINFEALVLLFGMMILVGFLRLSGFFENLVLWLLARVRSPRWLLALTIALSGGLSAFLVNDIVCIALTPLILQLTRKLRFDPLPHLIGLAVASNIGSSAAITGNPQNIIIGIHSRIPYLTFTLRLLPVALIGLLLAYGLLCLVYRQRLQVSLQALPENDANQPSESAAHRNLRRKAILVGLVTVVLFFVLPSQHLALIALAAASVLLLSRVQPAKIYRQVDWTLLVMFAGLFIVVHAFRLHVIDLLGFSGWTWLLERPIDVFSGVSAVLSNLVSNVPAVLLLEPAIDAMPETSRESAWLALAMSSTLAGNLTVLGSVANLIVVEAARREGVNISFLEYARAGVPLTLLTLAVGVVWLLWVPY